MKPEDRYLKFIRWEEEDQSYVGYCPDLFPWGGVCHAETEDEGKRERCRGPGCVEIRREEHDLDHDRRNTGAREQRSDAALDRTSKFVEGDNARANAVLSNF